MIKEKSTSDPPFVEGKSVSIGKRYFRKMSLNSKVFSFLKGNLRIVKLKEWKWISKYRITSTG